MFSAPWGRFCLLFLVTRDSLGAVSSAFPTDLPSGIPYCQLAPRCSQRRQSSLRCPGLSCCRGDVPSCPGDRTFGLKEGSLRWARSPSTGFHSLAIGQCCFGPSVRGHFTVADRRLPTSLLLLPPLLLLPRNNGLRRTLEGLGGWGGFSPEALWKPKGLQGKPLSDLGAL